MPTFKAKLAEGPTRVMNALLDRDQSFRSLQRDHGATSADMNLLTELGFIRATHLTAVGLNWSLTDDGRSAIQAPTPDKKEAP